MPSLTVGAFSPPPNLFFDLGEVRGGDVCPSLITKCLIANHFSLGSG